MIPLSIGEVGKWSSRDILNPAQDGYYHSTVGVPLFDIDVKAIWRFLARHNLRDLELTHLALFRYSVKKLLKDIPLNRKLEFLYLQKNELGQTKSVTAYFKRQGENYLFITDDVKELIPKTLFDTIKIYTEQDSIDVYKLNASQGLLWLLVAILRCQSLKKLSAFKNGFEKDEQELLRRWIQHHPTIEVFNIADEEEVNKKPVSLVYQSTDTMKQSSSCTSIPPIKTLEVQGDNTQPSTTATDSFLLQGLGASFSDYLTLDEIVSRRG